MADGSFITAGDIGLDVNPDEELEALNLRVVREEAERRAVVRGDGPGQWQRGQGGGGAGNQPSDALRSDEPVPESKETST